MDEKINVISVSYIEEGTDSPILKNVKSEFEYGNGSNVLEVNYLNPVEEECMTNQITNINENNTNNLNNLMGMFTCSRCTFSCTSMGDFISHCQTYREEEPFTCFQCGYLACDNLDFVEHSRSHIEDNYYRCFQCPYTTISISDIRHHIRVNHAVAKKKVDPVKCPLCDKFVASKYNLKLHIVKCEGLNAPLNNSLEHEESEVHIKQEIDESNIFTCPHCFFIFLSRDKLAVHMDKIHSKELDHLENLVYDVDEAKLNMIPRVTLERIYLCPICHFVFTSASVLNKHIITHKEVTECPVCKYNCETNTVLREHFMVHSSPDKLHVCTICEKRFLSAGKLKNHTKEAHESRRYNCEWCCQGVKSESELRLHMEAHAKIKEFYCPKCKFTAKNSSVLQFHMSRFHPSRKRFICADCGKSYKYKYSLERHNLNCPVKDIVKSPNSKNEERSSDENIENVCNDPVIEIDISQKEKLNCAECKASFREEEHLRKHLLVHYHSTPFRCPKCGCRFKTKHQLSHHMKTHSSKADYKCKICDKSFRYRHALNNHRIAHSDMRPFTCDVCGLTFKRKANYRRHYDIHSNVRPFLCPYCEYSGRRRDNLQKHIISHHPNAE